MPIGQITDKLLTDYQVAELAGVPVNTVRYWRQTSVLPFVKVGRHPRVWLSVFCKVFNKPKNTIFDSPSASVTMEKPGTLGGANEQA